MTGAATMRVDQFGRPTLSKDGRTITVHIPIKLRHQGGRKQVVTPAGATPWIPPPSRIDNTLVKAIVRAHRWRDMLESGDLLPCATSQRWRTSTSLTWGAFFDSRCSHPRSSKTSWKESSRRVWSSKGFSKSFLSNGTSSSRR
jgi:hypothetical protein